MRLALTGSSGFLGAALADALAARGHAVTGLVRTANSTPAVTGLERRRVNYADLATVTAALRGADAVVHAAARVHNTGPWREFATGTVALTQTVLAAAHAAGVAHFIHISTVGVYGFPARDDSPPVDETAPTGNIHRWNYYSRAKAVAEQLVGQAGADGKMAVTILRPTWLYGPGPDAILGRLIAALRAGRYRWIGDGQNRLSLLFLADAVDAIVRVVEQPAARHRVYNLAADELAPTQAAFITRLCHTLQLPLPTGRLSYPLAYRLGLAGECLAHLTAHRLQLPLSRLSVLLLGGHRRFNCDKIRHELGWQPQVHFNDGLPRAVEGFRSR
jgi:nucleoside-diphosphate-sugar epimerase